MDIQLVLFVTWAIMAFGVMLGTIIFAVWERQKLEDAESARAGSLVPEIFIIQEDFEEVLGRGYSERRDR